MTNPEQPPPDEDPGVRLMLAYQAGDEGAFDQLVEAYAGQVYALLTRFMGRSPQREDMAQEVFLRVIRARARYQPTARFSTWLYRIVFNLSVNETQRASSKDRAFSQAGHSGSDPEEAPLTLVDPNAASPSDAMEQGDVVRAVRAAIAELPESQRMALILAKYDEMPYAEIAEVLDSSEKAIKSMVHRARESLRESLAPFFQEEVA